MKKIKNKIIKPLFFYWIKKDFFYNLKFMEQYKLRKHIHKNIKNKKCIENKKSIANLVDYISGFVIATYSNPKEIPKIRESIEDEANFIVDEFIKSYLYEIKNKEVDLVTYLGIPKLELSEEEKTRLREKKELEINNLKNYRSQFENNKTVKEKCDFLFSYVEKLFKRNKRIWQPNIKHYAVAIWYIIYLCIEDVQQFSKEYDIEYIDDGEIRCLFNYFNLYIHNIMFKDEILFDLETRRVMFAASAIHPAQDDYVDNNDVSEDDIEIINKALKGEFSKEVKKELKPILKLIGVIYEKYDINNNPILVEILLELNKWQQYSIKQKINRDISEEELLKISFMKGGYAFAFFGYISLGKMNMLEFRHFFGMGAIFQIMDDLHDIPIDLENDVETIWTKRINKDVKADEVIYGIIGTQIKFENITNIIQSMRKPVFLRRMELFAIRLDLCKFYLMNRQYFTNEQIENFELVYDIQLEDFLEKFELKLDNIKSLEQFKQVLLEIKDSYIGAFRK